jgi:hypothetical protein
MIENLKASTVQALIVFAKFFKELYFNVLNTDLTSRKYPIDLAIIIFETILKD